MTPRSIRVWLFVTVLVVALAVAGGATATAVVSHQHTVAAQERAHWIATQDRWNAEHAAARRQAARERATREKEAEAAAWRRAAQARAARARAARVRAVRARAAHAAAARARATQARAARATARTSDAPSATATTHLLTGDITEPDINGALVTQIGGYPGQPLEEFGMKQLKRLESLLHTLRSGRTYPCPQGSGGGFGDIVDGAQVLVQDGTGNVLATAALTGGSLGVHGCTFTYQVQVPDADFYQVTVTHRGALTFSRDQLAAHGWHVSGTL